MESAGAPRRFKVARPRLQRPAGNDSRVPAKAVGLDAPLQTRHEAKIIGFGPMARVTTSFGEVYAQTLRKGDRVRTKDGNYLQIMSVNRMTLDADYLKYHPAALPVVIRAGALGPGLPSADLMLAPHQRVNQNQRIPGGQFQRAVDAIGRPQVYRKPEPMITYTTFHCGRPATVQCEGVWIDIAP
ncbi:MAG: Hint domain-containing protein [Paracoccaceae bacterium]